MSRPIPGFLRRGAGVDEQGCLLSSCAGNGTEGSNPSLSAIFTFQVPRSRIAWPVRELAGRCAVAAAPASVVSLMAIVADGMWEAPGGGDRGR